MQAPKFICLLDGRLSFPVAKPKERKLEQFCFGESETGLGDSHDPEMDPPKQDRSKVWVGGL
jgi:hypothetical protein